MTTTSDHTLRVLRDTVTGHLWLVIDGYGVELLPHEWMELRQTGDAELPERMQQTMNLRAFADASARADMNAVNRNQRHA